MAKKKEIKPIPTFPAVIMLLAFLAAMVVFVVYVVTPMGSSDISHVDSLGEQSFEVESSIEPPPPSVEEVKEYMSDANVGDVVLFGKYEQNGNVDDGDEPIEWVVLEEDKDSLLLISRCCLDCKPFNETREKVKWADSSLRAWLNGDFYDTAFSKQEKAGLIQNEYLSEVYDSAFITDNVFILSSLEAKQYYEYDSWRTCSATEYAISNGARVENGFAWWWLRTAALDNPNAEYVYFNGTIKDIGFAVDYDAVAVRPVIRVSADMEKETEESKID